MCVRKKMIYEHQEKEDPTEKRQKSYEEPLKEYAALRHLKKNIVKTRIGRINAASRLLSTERFLQAINIYYSCVSAVFAILGLVVEDKTFTIWSVIFTVVLAISIVYLNAQKYGNRSQELKNNYISLHELLFKVELAEAKNEVENFSVFADEYCKLLQTSENHNNMDNLKRKRDNEEGLSVIEMIYYYGIKTLWFAVKAFLIVVPLILFGFFAHKGIFSGILW